MIDSKRKITQEQFGELVGVTQQAISKLAAKGVFEPGGTAQQWLLSYCEHLREEAAGRSAELMIERTRKEKEQADKLADERKIRRKEHVPVYLLTESMSSIARQVVSMLEALPVKLKKETKIKIAHIKIVEREIVGIRNAIVKVNPDWGEIEEDIVSNVKQIPEILKKLPARLKRTKGIDNEMIDVVMNQLNDSWVIVSNGQPDRSQIDVA